MGNTGKNAPHGRKLHVAIVGAGVNGLTTAYFLSAFPEIDVYIFESHNDPRLGRRPRNLSPTFGGREGSNTARHITGGESLVPPQGLSHINAWNAAIANDGQTGTIDRYAYKDQFDSTAIRFTAGSSPKYDRFHALFNYAGLEIWSELIHPELSKAFISRDGMKVFYSDDTIFADDVLGDTQRFHQGKNFAAPSVVPTPDIEMLTPTTPESFSIPGLALDVRRFGIELISILETRDNVHIEFDSPIVERPENFDHVIWAGNTTEKQVGYDRITGLLGYWASIDNYQLGLTEPFKFALDFPMAFVNVTPDLEGRVQISGGLYWVDFYGVGAQEVVQFHKREFLNGLKEHFLIDEVQQLSLGDISGCIRSCGPQGLPVVETTQGDIDISGGSKAGTTQAPIMALSVVERLGFDIHEALTRSWGDAHGLMLTHDALKGLREYSHDANRLII